MSYASTILGDGPLGYWKLNESAGSGTIADSSGNGYSGTVDSGVTLGSVALLPNDPGTSAAFGGAAVQLIRIGAVGNALTDGAGQSIEWWTRIDGLPSLQAGDFEFVKITTANDEYGRYHGDGLAYPAQFMGSRINAFAAIPTSGLHHFVVTRKTGGNFVWYMDGVVLASTATPSALAAPSGLQIGGEDGNTTPLAFWGKIAHVSLWNKELSAAQQLAHYKAGLVGAGYATLVQAFRPRVYVRLDQTTGTVANDSSGNGNNGAYGASVGSGGITTTPGALASDTDAGMAFNGSGTAYVYSFPDVTDLTTGSLELWLKTSDASAGYHQAAGHEGRWSLFIKGGWLITYDWNAQVDRDPGWHAVADGAWHHAVMTFRVGSPGAAEIYVDSVKGTSLTWNPGNSLDTSLQIAANVRVAVQQFTGSLDEVSVYDFAMTSAQVGALYTEAITVPSNNGVAVKGPTRVGSVNEGSSRATGQGTNFASIDNPGVNRVGGL